MHRLCSLSLAAVLALTTGACLAIEFPVAPPNQKAAEAAGLARVEVAELQTLFQRAIVADQAKSGKCKFVYHTDGTVERKGGVNKPGKWRIDEAKNVYCKAFHRKDGYSENCFSVYRAADNVHYFDYDASDGLYAQVWRCAGIE